MGAKFLITTNHQLLIEMLNLSWRKDLKVTSRTKNGCISSGLLDRKILKLFQPIGIMKKIFYR